MEHQELRNNTTMDITKYIVEATNSDVNWRHSDFYDVISDLGNVPKLVMVMILNINSLKIN